MSTSLPLYRQRAGWRTGLVGVVLACLLGTLAYLLAAVSAQLFPVRVFEAAAPRCEPSVGPCTAAFDATRFIRLRTGPRMPLASEPLRILIDTAGFRAERAMLELSSIDMSMGLVREDLLDTGRGSFAADVTLPVCVRRQMVWRATVTAGGVDGVHRATFDFEVNRR